MALDRRTAHPIRHPKAKDRSMGRSFAFGMARASYAFSEGASMCVPKYMLVLYIVSIPR